MKCSEFFYELPEDLIAQHPLQNRADSRLLLVERKTRNIKDSNFNELPGLLRPGDLLVFNDSKVIPARLFGVKQSGGRTEVLIERVINNKQAVALIRASKAPRIGSRLCLEGENYVTVTGREGEFFTLRLDEAGDFTRLMEQFGHIPLPPYIKRQDLEQDRARYQTVYARRPGAVAAPTAGLHFTEMLIGRLSEKNINTGFVTLHVGAGTFQPVRCENIEDHKMHNERYELDEMLCKKIAQTKDQGGRIIAVGTTVVRTLESAAQDNGLKPTAGETGIFIYPGYQFKLVDGLITNFHLPESTLIMLICAFAGKPLIMDAYRHAIAEKYRFYSYGDAMLIL